MSDKPRCLDCKGSGKYQPLVGPVETCRACGGSGAAGVVIAADPDSPAATDGRYRYGREVVSAAAEAFNRRVIDDVCRAMGVPAHLVDPALADPASEAAEPAAAADSSGLVYWRSPDVGPCWRRLSVALEDCDLTAFPGVAADRLDLSLALSNVWDEVFLQSCWDAMLRGGMIDLTFGRDSSRFQRMRVVACDPKKRCVDLHS